MLPITICGAPLPPPLPPTPFKHLFFVLYDAVFTLIGYAWFFLRLVSNSSRFTVLSFGAALLAAKSATQGVWITGRSSTPQCKRPRSASAAFSSTGPEFTFAAHVSVDSCRTPKRHGRITHQPGNVQYGGFCPDLPCYPPLSLGSSRKEEGRALLLRTLCVHSARLQLSRMHAIASSIEFVSLCLYF